jgi:acid phosphatase type 7
VLTLGDNAYESGTAFQYTNCYGPTWGRHKARTRPSPGNHEYQTANASGYFGYFGSAAGPPGRGYYSFDAGPWHLVSLNSERETGATAAQAAWLRADLAATSAPCVLAFLHRPRFTAGNYSDFASMQPLWDVLYAANADVVLSGHDHVYERYRPMNPAGLADAARGLRQFVVGTGGRGHYALRADSRREAGRTGTFGILKMTLRATGYDWQFLPVAGQTYSDAGSGSCH